MGKEFQPEVVLNEKLTPAGFMSSQTTDGFAWVRGKGQCLQQIGITYSKSGRLYSISVWLGIQVAEVEEFVSSLTGEPSAGVATVGGSFSRVRTPEQASGWYLPANKDGLAQFESIANYVASEGVAILDQYSDLQALADLAVQEMKSPGSGDLGLRHVYELPAILYLAGRKSECRESIRLAREKLAAVVAPDEIPLKFPEQHKYLSSLQQLL
jgi:hypothetical protein